MKLPLTTKPERPEFPCPTTKIAERLVAWFGQHARGLPWRRTREPYAIWVSEIMLQQTQVKTVIPYWERWMRELPDVRALARAKAQKLHKLWEGLGYYRRVRNLQQAAQVIVERHGAKFPSGYEAILALPGVGRYTAGAIASIAFHQPRPILDGNVMRVLTRVFGIAGDPRGKVVNARLWSLAEELVRAAAESNAGQGCLPAPPAGLNGSGSPGCSQLNQALMELGALICTPRIPRCDACPLAKNCRALAQGTVGKLPALGPRPRPTPRHFVALVAERRGRFLVRQRPAGSVNAHLWEFPNVEVDRKSSATLSRMTERELRTNPPNGLNEVRGLRKLAEGSGPVTGWQYLGTIRHSITRYRIRLDVFFATIPPGSRGPTSAGRWCALSMLGRLPFASAHKQILQRLSLRSTAPEPGAAKKFRAKPRLPGVVCAG